MLGMVVNTGSEFSLTLSKAALVLSSLPVHINNRYNWRDSAFFSTYVSKGVVVNTGSKPLSAGKSAILTLINVIGT
jgi:hypothetical protein